MFSLVRLLLFVRRKHGCYKISTIVKRFNESTSSLNSMFIIVVSPSIYEISDCLKEPLGRNHLERKEIGWSEGEYRHFQTVFFHSLVFLVLVC